MTAPYRVPSMEEIRALEPNGFLAASTFSGCGGSSLGYRMAGFKVGYANEFVPAARECYAANAAPYTFVDGRDIREVTAKDVLEKLGVKAGALDLFDGSPPCASFSTAGSGSAGWGKVRSYSDVKQRTDDLFFEWIRLVDGIRPKTFVAENVAGLVRGVAVGYFNEILNQLKGLGYRVGARLLDAQWLGVPQQRTRIIFVGVREDLGLDPAHPEPLDFRYSVGDACPWMADASLMSRDPNFYKSNPSASEPVRETAFGSRPAPAVTATGIRGTSRGEYEIVGVDPSEGGVDISKYAIGGEWDKIAEGEQSGKFFNMIKASRTKPSPTILASHGSGSIAGVVHPTEKRKFSIPELKRICSFPDDFVTTGTYQQQWERLGRAVPPVMMSYIAAAVRDKVLIPYRDLRAARKAAQ